jgi:hypothetical protein
MHFGMKSYLKNNHYHTIKYTLKIKTATKTNTLLVFLLLIYYFNYWFTNQKPTYNNGNYISLHH